MVAVGLHWYRTEEAQKYWIVSKTTDGKTVETADTGKSLEEILEDLSKIDDEVVIGFDSWGGKMTVETIANFVSKRNNMKITLEGLTGEYKAKVSAEQLAVNALKRFA